MFCHVVFSVSESFPKEEQTANACRGCQCDLPPSSCVCGCREADPRCESIKVQRSSDCPSSQIAHQLVSEINSSSSVNGVKIREIGLLAGENLRVLGLLARGHKALLLRESVCIYTWKDSPVVRAGILLSIRPSGGISKLFVLLFLMCVGFILFTLSVSDRVGYLSHFNWHCQLQFSTGNQLSLFSLLYSLCNNKNII